MKRQQALQNWLHSQFPEAAFNLELASADASYRRYFRATFSGHSLIVMDAPPRQEDCRPFVHVAQLFGAAGVNVPQAIDAITDEAWDRVMETNLSSVMALTRELVPQMRQRKWGRIVHISSIMGFVSKEKRNAYSATKAALIGNVIA